MNTDLENSTILITGASGGIGGATAREFAKEDASLVLHGHSRMEKLDKLSEDLRTNSITVQADLTDPDETKSMFRRVKNEFGTPEGIVANAGVWPEAETPIKDMTLERWNETVTTDQTSVFLCSREYFQALEDSNLDRGSLVIVGSTAAVFGEENHADYAAAKAAITYGLTRSLKNEMVRVAPKGRVNAVCPGWTRTEMAEPDINDPKKLSKTYRTRSLKSVAEPEEVARSIVFLSSHRLASHVTGEILTVSGGMEGRTLHEPDEIETESE